MDGYRIPEKLLTPKDLKFANGYNPLTLPVKKELVQLAPARRKCKAWYSDGLNEHELGEQDLPDNALDIVNGEYSYDYKELHEEDLKSGLPEEYHLLASQVYDKLKPIYDDVSQIVFEWTI